MSAYRILVVDDELPNLESLERILKSDGAAVEVCQNPHEALSRIRKGAYDVVLTDLRMESMDGLGLLEAAKTLDPSVEIILMTAFGTVQLAVEAMKKGAYDFITKPLQRLQVLRTVHKALEKRQLVHENLSLKEELRSSLGSSRADVLGRSESMRRLTDIAQQSARSRANVLIEGESGTGKGVLAEFIHRNSDVASGVFVKINCTAIPENLLEAELFGYEPGAFTGANRRKKGRVEIAHEGTLFLDEIGIAPLTFQAKLLRFLQEGEFERLGSNETLKVNTRVISATNTDLKKAIENGQLREDLYYRLNVIHLSVPPLRDRKEDVPVFAQKFIEDSAKKNGRPTPLLSSEALECLINYSWPGNVRELQNLMERVVVLNRDGVIRIEDLPREVGHVERRMSVVVPLGTPLRQIEQLMMDETLKWTKGDKKLTASLLGVHPRTIYRYLESLEPAPEAPPPAPPDPEISTN